MYSSRLRIDNYHSVSHTFLTFTGGNREMPDIAKDKNWNPSLFWILWIIPFCLEFSYLLPLMIHRRHETRGAAKDEICFFAAISVSSRMDRILVGVAARTRAEESPWNANVIITVVTTARSRNLNWVSRLSAGNCSIPSYLQRKRKRKIERRQTRQGAKGGEEKMDRSRVGVSDILRHRLGWADLIDGRAGDRARIWRESIVAHIIIIYILYIYVSSVTDIAHANDVAGNKRARNMRGKKRDRVTQATGVIIRRHCSTRQLGSAASKYQTDCGIYRRRDASRNNRVRAFARFRAEQCGD